jgi:hypothetical protein
MGFKRAKSALIRRPANMVVGENTCDGREETFEILNDDVPVIE